LDEESIFSLFDVCLLLMVQFVCASLGYVRNEDKIAKRDIKHGQGNPLKTVVNKDFIILLE